MHLDGFEREGSREAKMPYLCAKCNKEVEKQQGYEYQGKLSCEDCYMDILSPPKACDPWAVHSA
jgi:DNA-directed RNA polymerase subunit RPC12/RpoP